MWWLTFAAFAAAVATVPPPSLSAARLRQIGLLPDMGTHSRSAALRRRLQRRPRVVGALSGLAGGLVGAAGSSVLVGPPGSAVAAAAAARVGVVVLRVA
jgi:hypothetical protein